MNIEIRAIQFFNLEKFKEKELKYDDIINLMIDFSESENASIKNASKQLYDEAYRLKEHCIEHNYIDWEDDSIDGCKDFDKAMNNISNQLI